MQHVYSFPSRTASAPVHARVGAHACMRSSDASVLLSDLSTACGRNIGLSCGTFPNRQMLLQRKRASLIGRTSCLHQLTFHLLRPNGQIFMAEAHCKTPALLIQWALEGSDNDQFTHDYYSSQNLSSSPIKSTTHLSYSFWYAATIHHFQMYCPYHADRKTLTYTHKKTKHFCLYNLTEQTLSHFRNCYFSAGLFLLSALSHKLFLPLLTFPSGRLLPSTLLNRKLLFSTANFVSPSLSPSLSHLQMPPIHCLHA